MDVSHHTAAALKDNTQLIQHSVMLLPAETEERAKGRWWHETKVQHMSKKLSFEENSAGEIRFL